MLAITSQDIFNLTMKIVLLGDGGVGKTALRLNFMGLGFQNHYMMTVGADFAMRQIPLKTGEFAGHTLRTQIWDLAGQDNFAKVRSLYYNGSHGAMIVYDCTRVATFQNIDNWLKELNKNIVKPVPVVLIANKTDLRADVDYSLSKEDGIRMAQRISKDYLHNSFEVPYFETSAKTGANVNTAFEILAQQVMAFFH